MEHIAAGSRDANFDGSSPAMEAEGVKIYVTDLWRKVKVKGFFI